MHQTIDSNAVQCVVCGEIVDNSDIQLCNKDECMEQFSDIYLQVG